LPELIDPNPVDKASIKQADQCDSLTVANCQVLMGIAGLCEWHYYSSLTGITYLPLDRSVAPETVIAAFGTISLVGPPVLEGPERTGLSGLLPTVMFQAHVERNAGRLP
jgi:hypothetical protein